MNRQFKTSQRWIMFGILNSDGLLFGTSSRTRPEHFEITKDSDSTASSSVCTLAVSTIKPMLTSEWTMGDESSIPQTITMMPLNLTLVNHCESQSSINLSNSQMTVPPFEQLCLSPLAVEPPMLKVSQDLQLQIQTVACPMGKLDLTAKQNGRCHRKHLLNFEKIEISSSIVSASSLDCSSTDCDSTGDRNTSLSPTSCTSVPWLTTPPEIPPILHLHKYPSKLAFPNHMSCVISKHPDRLRAQKATEAELISSAANPAGDFPIIQRTVRKTVEELPEDVTLGGRVPCKKSRRG